MGGGGTPRQPGAWVGKEVEGTVRKALPRGETFIRLTGPEADGFYYRQSYERIKEGDALTVRVEAYDARHKTYRVRPVE